jgi:hypothetical protein
LLLLNLRVSASPHEIRIDIQTKLHIVFPSVRRPVRRRKAKIDLPAGKAARTNCVLKKRSLKSEYGLESLGFDPDPESGFEI